MPAEIAGLVVLLSAFPAEIIYIYATTRVLRMSHVAAFWALRLSLMLAITLTRASFPELAPWMSLFAGVGMYALLPLVMSKGRLTYRVFVVLALFFAGVDRRHRHDRVLVLDCGRAFALGA